MNSTEFTDYSFGVMVLKETKDFFEAMKFDEFTDFTGQSSTVAMPWSANKRARSCVPSSSGQDNTIAQGCKFCSA